MALLPGRRRGGGAIRSESVKSGPTNIDQSQVLLIRSSRDNRLMLVGTGQREERECDGTTHQQQHHQTLTAAQTETRKQ
jgi:hypothetical protein